MDIETMIGGGTAGSALLVYAIRYVINHMTAITKGLERVETGLGAVKENMTEIRTDIRDLRADVANKQDRPQEVRRIR